MPWTLLTRSRNYCCGLFPDRTTAMLWGVEHIPTLCADPIELLVSESHADLFAHDPVLYTQSSDMIAPEVTH